MNFRDSSYLLLPAFLEDVGTLVSDAGGVKTPTNDTGGCVVEVVEDATLITNVPGKQKFSVFTKRQSGQHLRK